MIFSQTEIELARQLRRDGLSWKPQAGHYVYDETEFCNQPSPFQERVYFVLNYPYFMKAAGGVERFKEIMTWLPTWDDAREILRSQRVSNEQVLDYLHECRAIESGSERLALYRLIARALQNSSDSEPLATE